SRWTVRVRRAYNLVSTSRESRRATAILNRFVCRLFLAVVTRFISSGGTHNPLVPGSNPGGPTHIEGAGHADRAPSTSVRVTESAPVGGSEIHRRGSLSAVGDADH